MRPTANRSLPCRTDVLQQTVDGGGGLYTLSWWEAGYSLGSDPQTYSVSLGGTQLHPTFSTPVGRGWVQQVLSFNAAGGTELLSFTGTSSSGVVFLDNISLTGAAAVSAVPEPETFAMMLAGLGALGFASRRQRKSA
ncbi:FxDxF family PEP-CTERM protein [Sphaerotilus sp.]|uniref:FxDxF family PEP-CTERM protein n=1 Tax=Sphaerotilus sp. TaxID=2093942 RepID=UPI002ACD9D40|nr:FxDxF family PEP-CTERM protein [Sphaerotilus sp.]MDZ7856808.1 FxDxF family PEP-CTERM protein [Sphaerotilus sp.]